MRQAKFTTMRWMYCRISILLMVVLASPAQAADSIEFPHFRQVDKAQIKPELALPGKITLLADEDFAPFSFKAIDGKSAGISQQLALSACAQLKITCDVKYMPYAALLQALRQKQGDIIVGGPSADSTQAQAFVATRPYYLSFSRFLARSGGNFQGVDSKSLAGRRLGSVKGSAQEQFLKNYFGRSSLVVFETNASLFVALRTGSIDLAFVDSTMSGFWLKGEDARGCCVATGGAFMDRATITRSLTMLMRSEDNTLRLGFDYALDQMQENGTTAKVLQAYLPSSPF